MASQESLRTIEDTTANPAPLGLLGFGRIARQVLVRFRALGFSRCLVTDPGLEPASAAEADVEAVALEELCRDSDVVSVHTPLTDDTRHLIDAQMLGLMKPTAILVNASRGGIVDESALAEALESRRLFGAGIDVFEQEPPDADNPLLHSPHTVVSDHTAWYSEASVCELQHKAVQEVLRVYAGETPLHWVNAW